MIKLPDPNYAHFPIYSLHYLAKREDLLHCSINTWYKYSMLHGFARPYTRYNLKEYKEGIRASRTNEIWHIDITEIKLASGQKYYLQVVIDNFSRYILAWQINKTKEAFFRSLKNNYLYFQNPNT